MVSQLEALVDESHGHSGILRYQSSGRYSPTGLFRSLGAVSGGRHADRKSFQARRLSALRSSLGAQLAFLAAMEQRLCLFGDRGMVGRQSRNATSGPESTMTRRVKAAAIPDRSPSVRAANGSVSSSVGFAHRLSAAGRRLTGRAARGAGTDGSNRLTVDVKPSVRLVHFSPNRRFSDSGTALLRTLETLGCSHQVAVVPPECSMRNNARICARR